MINDSGVFKPISTLKEDENKVDSTEPRVDPNFLKKCLSDTSQHHHKAVNRNDILNQIRKFSPIDISELKRKIGTIGYSTLWGIIREFEFVGLVSTKKYFDNETGTKFKIVFIPQKKEEVKDATNTD